MDILDNYFIFIKTTTFIDENLNIKLLKSYANTFLFFYFYMKMNSISFIY